MKIKPIIGSQLSGSLGGITASHNRGGAYLRQRATPVNPSTPQQQVVRSAMGSLSSAWSQTLTQAQRDAWSAYATQTPVTNAVGDSILLTGQQMYVGCNTFRRQLGLADADDGPTIPGLTELDAVDVTVLSATSQQATVTYTDGQEWTGDGGALALYLSPAISSGRVYYKGPYRLAGAIDGAAVAPTSPQQVDAPYTVTALRQYRWRMRAVGTDGRLSSEQSGSIVAVAV